ncbi:MAG TPA: DoxX family protein [Planctomycetota bacterium]
MPMPPSPSVSRMRYGPMRSGLSSCESAPACSGFMGLRREHRRRPRSSQPTLPAGAMTALPRGGWRVIGVLEIVGGILLVVPAVTTLAAAALTLETLVPAAVMRPTRARAPRRPRWSGAS